MAKRRRRNGERGIRRNIKDGRGQGRGTDYNPWLHIQDVPSKGLVTRVKGWKTGRVHHLLSQLELWYFYILEWSQAVTDTREQYPLLPLEETLSIARQLGVRHPTDPHTKEPVVMTTDFVLTVRRGCSEVDQARTVKYKKDLHSKRVLEKLEIERRYWESHGVDWKIVTETQIPVVLAKNIQWLHQYRELKDFATVSAAEAEQIISVLTLSIGACGASPLRSVTLRTDDRLGLEPGTSLSLVRHLLACRRWRVDMRRPINPCERLIMADGLA
ncbi:MAG: heteromeric transposase endonuclease subunit TnsA [Acidobacteria bacterium]|nr:heteromeric transposase endonuclease subunit TnsA [Acidobacteriota bacterium]